MCGINGIVRLDGAPFDDRARLEAMAERQRHRGPDGRGFLLRGPVGFGHLRLSILDLSEAGAQPMTYADGRLAITFNGEVYNYLELRDELKALGHEFHTGTDTEVILAAYLQWGTDCLRRFNGMFAFALHDAGSSLVFCARDRFGVKPFYWAQAEGCMVFASEIKAILASGLVPARPDLDSLHDFLATGATDHRPETCFEGIRHLPPGHFAIVKDGRVEVGRWWRLEPEPSGEAPAALVRRLLQDAVRLRLRSDVPVGTCLSGGLDSSSIVCLMRRVDPQGDLHAFTASFPGAPRDETRHARIVAGHAGAELHLVEPSVDRLRADVERLVVHQDEPFGSTSIYAQWEVMRLAHGSGLKVLLDGQGADEELAGYTYFYANYFAELLRGGRVARLAKEVRAYRRTQGSWYAPKVALYYMLPKALQARVRSPARFFDKAFLREHGRAVSFLDSTRDAKDLGSALRAHMEDRLPHLLRYEDRNSMAFSIETRLPFLDYRLVQALFGLPSEQKIADGWTKKVLRDAMEGILPPEIQWRKDKVGFETDEAAWFRRPDVRPWIEEILGGPRLRARGIADSDALVEAYRQHCSGAADHARVLWRFISVELWFRAFIDAAAPASRAVSAGRSTS